MEKRLGSAPWHHPQDPDTHFTDPSHRMVTSHGKVFLELPPDLGLSPHPAIPQLSSVRVLLEARRPSLRSGGLHRPWEPGQSPSMAFPPHLGWPPLPGAPWGAPEYTWLSGGWVAIAHFYCITHIPLPPGLCPGRQKVWMSQPETMHLLPSCSCQGQRGWR